MPDKKLAANIKKLAPWFHNIHLPGGLETAPNHPLGDFPSYKWKVIAQHLPQDMTGCRVLDIGCNAGFYAVECAVRGAQVTAIDIDPRYLKQAKWIAGVFSVGNRINFHQMQVYDLAEKKGQFDVVLFLGVFYHLRYPMLAIDIISKKANDLLVFQSVTLQQKEEPAIPDDVRLTDRDIMLQHGWPSMAFIENKFMGDPTNWWVPNPAAIKAMFRTAGFDFLQSPGQEVYFFRKGKNSYSVVNGWNKSEYLSATGKPWIRAARIKTGS